MARSNKGKITQKGPDLVKKLRSAVILPQFGPDDFDPIPNQGVKYLADHRRTLATGGEI